MFLGDLREDTSILAWGFCGKWPQTWCFRRTHTHLCSPETLNLLWLSVEKVKVGRARSSRTSNSDIAQSVMLTGKAQGPEFNSWNPQGKKADLNSIYL